MNIKRAAGWQWLARIVLNHPYWHSVSMPRILHLKREIYLLSTDCCCLFCHMLWTEGLKKKLLPQLFSTSWSDILYLKYLSLQLYSIYCISSLVFCHYYLTKQMAITLKKSCILMYGNHYCSKCTTTSQRSDVSIKCSAYWERRICPWAANLNEKNKLINRVNKVSGSNH